MTLQSAAHRLFATHRLQSTGERLADGAVHAAGLSLGIVGTVALPAATTTGKTPVELAALAVYLVTLLAMLTSSAAYNLTHAPDLKWLLRRIDHSAIYLLIAGTYTPVLAHLADRTAALGLGAAVWGGALAGISLRLARPGQNDRLAIAICLFLGWLAVFNIDPIIAALPALTFKLIVAGGVLYSLGVIFHVWERLKFQNAIWHIFVLAAATCHFAAMWVLYAT